MIRENFTLGDALNVWSDWDDYSQKNNLRGVIFLNSLQRMQLFHLAVALENGFNDPIESIGKISFEIVLGQKSRVDFMNLYEFIKQHQCDVVSVSASDCP